MQKLMKRFHKNQKGFTLVELMVVVVIIGVLVAIAIPIFNNVAANAREKACHANQRTIDGAIAMYEAETGLEFTANMLELIDGTTIDGEVFGGYLQSTPTCPSSGDPYTFTAITDPATPRLVDGCPNTGSTTDTDHLSYRPTGTP